MDLFKKKKTEAVQVEQVVEVLPPVDRVSEALENNKLETIEQITKQVSLNLKKEDYTSDAISRTEEIMPEEVTRFIDVVELDEKSGKYKTRTDELDNSVEIGGALGHIPPSQMPYIQLSNFNNIWVRLRNNLYMDFYKQDENGQLLLDTKGEPMVEYTRVINVGTINRTQQLLSNLAYNGNRPQLQAETMIGIRGGSPVALGSKYTDAMELMFGPTKKKK